MKAVGFEDVCKSSYCHNYFL